MKQVFLLITIISSFASCNQATISSDRILSLYRQRIPDTRYVIYEFNIAGHMAFDGSNLGITLLDSNETFSENKIEKLPSVYFIGKPVISDLKMIDINYSKSTTTEKDTLLTPFREYSQKFNGISVNTTEYKITYGSATTSTGLMEYQFDGIKETNDSLIFFNVTKLFGGKIFSSTASFIKGNIKVVDSTDDNINYIEVDQAIIQRSDIYKPTKPFELVPNQPVVGIATYRFYPKRNIKSSALTDFGIYKRVK